MASRFASFLFGLLLGSSLVFTSLKYHLVRADDGLHFIPKQSPIFAKSFVDIRNFGPSDWRNQTDLAMAIQRAGKGDLLLYSASGQLIDYVDDLVY